MNIFKKIFRIVLEISKKNNYNFGRDFIYTIYYENDIYSVVNILKKIGIFDKIENEQILLKYQLSSMSLDAESDLKVFLRAVYMVCGSLTNPEKNYHLEFYTHKEVISKFLLDILNYNDIRSQIVKRRETAIVYIKDSDSISDFLNLIGAHNSMFKFEDIRIKKNLRNKVNRIVNCETANLLKISKNFVKHKKAIEYIMEKRTLDYLSPELKELALLRLDNEDDSLKMLGEKLTVPLSKSGVNHRLNKIESIAMKIFEEEKRNGEKRS